MNLTKAKELVALAIDRDAYQLILDSQNTYYREEFIITQKDNNSGKLSDDDIDELLPQILKLKKLQHLDLSGNNLTYLNPAFVLLKNLKYLDLKNNQLTTFDKEFAKLDKLKELKLFGNPLPFPVEILADYKNPQKILNFIVDYFEAKELKPLNEAKLVVVGEANVGKTCVINRLIHNKFIKPESTHGIEIHRWENVELKNKEKVQLNVWDFGGQEIMHSTHQFFFTKRTVYVLVVNARENEDENKTEEWLQRIQNLSRNSPVFIVGNKIDENNRGTDRSSLGYFDIERKPLLKKFPNLIKGFYGISSDVNQKQFDFLFNDFKNSLIFEIGKLEEIHKRFPSNWFEIKAQLEEMRANKVPYITFRDYLSRCIKADIEKEESQRTLIDFMHDLGVALSFQDDKELRDLAVLNPEWVTHGVYALIDNPQIKLERGILKHKNISNYLNKTEYPEETQEFIIKMMRKFRLLIDIKQDEIFMIPDLLPNDEPDLGNWGDTLHFQYSYDIYEKSILRRFMVEMFHLCSEGTYWRNGIVLKKEYFKEIKGEKKLLGCNRALIRADVKHKTISIKIDGNQNTRREFIAVIRSKFDEIHANFNGLVFKEMLGHPRHPNILRDYARLIKMEVNNKESEFVDELEIDLPVKEWLNGFYSVLERQSKENERVNNIYIYGDGNKVVQGMNNSLTDIQKYQDTIDEISSKMDKSQKQEMGVIAEKIIQFIEAKNLTKLNTKEINELEEVKKEEWETKLKFVIPLIPKIPFLENFLPSAGLEATRKITVDDYISRVQKTLYGDDLQIQILEDD